MPKLIFLPQGGLLGQSPKADAEARFKAKVLSQFVLYNELKHVVELEYGHSSVAYHQLTQFPSYRGFEANKHTVTPAPSRSSRVFTRVEPGCSLHALSLRSESVQSICHAPSVARRCMRGRRRARVR